MNTFIPPVNIVSLKENKIWLNSALDEMMFGKTKSSLLLNNKGIIAFLKENDISFSEWKFTETCFFEGKVFFTGPFSGTPLQILIEKQAPNLEDVLYKICTVYAEALKNSVNLPCNGPSGIIISKDANQILFLPEKTFDSAMANFGRDVYNFYQDSWRDYIQTGAKALMFALGTMAYFACAKKLPFNTEKDLKISDRNFLPLEYEVNGINKKLASVTDTLLRGKSLETDFPLELLKKELFEGESRKNALPENEFLEKVKKYTETSRNKLHRLRFFRRNWPKFAAGFIFALIISIAVLSIITETGKKPTVIGLDSTQTTKVFYRGIHTMDTDLMLAAAKDCPEAQRYISQVPQLYVTGQMRSAFNFESGVSTPENWFYFEPDSTKSYSHYIYGITNFQIDGEADSLNISVPTRKNHPGRKLFSETGNEKIEKNPDAQHTVTYYLVHNQDNLIYAEKYTTLVTLKYIKKRWQILSLDQKSVTQILSPLPVSLAYKAALAESKGNILQAVDSIRKDYQWVPTEESLRIEGERLDKIGY